MTKMIKMSLIAAVAVTGMTSTVSAQPLEEAIKNVDLSGNVRYRYTGGKVNNDATNNYRLEFAVKSKVNDMVTATVASSINASTTDAAGDADPVATGIKEANFAFALPGATVIAGKQALATPFASGQLEDQQGTGVVALVPVAGVTIAAGLYLNTDAVTNVYKVDMDGAAGAAKATALDLGANNIAALAVIGAAGPVKYAAWYAKVSETSLGTNNTVAAGKTDIVVGSLTGLSTATAQGALNTTNAGATAVNLNLSAPVGPVNVEVNYAKVDYTLSGAGAATLAAAGIKELSPSQTRVVVSGKVDTVTLAAGIVMAGKDGGDVTLGDNDSSANFGTMEYFTGDKLKDTNAYYLAAFAPVGPVKVGVEYGTTSAIDGSAAVDQKLSELKLSAAYAMSKNFTVSAYITRDSSDNATAENMDENRVEIKYTF